MNGPILKGIVAILMAVMLFSCKNDLEEIRSLEFADTLANMKARNIRVLYSESGMVKVELISPRVIHYHSAEDPYQEFPEGFEVLFYDTAQLVKSRISADYGISYEKSRMMEARYNVVVENVQKGEVLETEELFWDQKKEIIYSNKFVKITRGDEVITGDGLTSDQAFENVEITNPRGLIEIVEDEE